MAGSSPLSGSDVWVAQGGDCHDERIGDGARCETGALVRVIRDPKDALYSPIGIAVGGGHVWVSPEFDGSPDGWTGLSVTELDARTGALVKVIDAFKYGLNAPGDIAVGDGRVWVVNNDSLTEMDAKTGALVRRSPPRNTTSTAPLPLPLPADVFGSRAGAVTPSSSWTRRPAP